MQHNAMRLTVGWAWMNFYTRFAAIATSRAADHVAVVLNIKFLIFVYAIISIVNYIFQKIHLGMARDLQTTVDAFAQAARKDV